MTNFHNTFEGGTNGVALTLANSGGTSGIALTPVVGTGCSLNYSSSLKTSGSIGLACVSVSGYSNYVYWDESSPASRGVIRLPIYLRSADDTPSATTAYGRINNVGITSMSTIQVELTSRKLLPADAAGTNIVALRSATVLALDTLYWVELAATCGTTTSNGTISWVLYSSDGVTQLETQTSSAMNTGTTNVGRYRFGRAASSTWAATQIVDDIRADTVSSGWLGPIPINTDWSFGTNDLLGITDTGSPQITNVLDTYSDLSGLLDNLLVIAGSGRSISDTEGITDTLLSNIDLAPTAYGESVGILDAFSALLTGGRIVSDVCGFVDSLGLVFGFGQTLGDVLGITDSASVHIGYSRSLSDVLGSLDGITFPINAIRNAAENLGLVDSLSWFIDHVLQFIEQETLIDIMTYGFSASGAVFVNENLAILDALQAISDMVSNYPDALSLSDLLSKIREEPETDVSGSVDSLSTVLDSGRLISDSLGLQDNYDATTTTPPPAFDSFGNTIYSGDSLDVQRDSARSKTDVLIAYDGLAIQHDRTWMIDVGDSLNINSDYRTGDGTSPWADVDGALELLGIWDGHEIKPIGEVFRPNIITP